jgi:hypothetical protein
MLDPGRPEKPVHFALEIGYSVNAIPTKEERMGMYRSVYDFAAKAGALEGYVYPKEKMDPKYLPVWVDHIVEGYQGLSPEARAEFQDLCDLTIGRAIAALVPIIGADHEVIRKLKGLTAGTLPSSPDDFPDRRKAG